MSDLITSVLKNLGCSYCQEYEFQENYNKENYKSWSLYLKEYEMYSAMILYNDKLKKDISYIINKGESVFLLDENNEILVKLEFISKSDDEKTSILVPTDEYQSFYEKIEQLDKKFDKDLNAQFIGNYNIKKCTEKKIDR
jgi:hypothetical protein